MTRPRHLPYSTISGAAATQEACVAIIQALAGVMKVHGPDPMGSVVVASGIVMALQQIDEIDPTVTVMVREALNRRAAA